MARKKETFLGNVRANMRFAWVQWRMHMRGWLSRRGAFLVQMFGMVGNDLGFVLIWYFFFLSVDTVNGWSFVNMIALQGLGFLGVSLVFFFSSGEGWLVEIVPSGKFDTLLLAPRPLLLRVLLYANDPAAAGDMFLGALMVLAYGVMTHTLLSTILFTALLLPAVMMIYQGFSLLSTSMTFYFPDNAHIINRQIMSAFLSPSMYPAGLFEGFAKVFFTLVIPSLFVAGIPAEILRTHSLTLLAGVWVAGIIWLTFGVLFFHVAVRKYESGNALGMSAE